MKYQFLAGIMSLSMIGLAVGLPLAVPARAADAAHKIKITQAPPKGGGPDSWGTMNGTASGPDVDQLRVVMYAITDKAYVQPTAADPYTPIKGGKWTAGTHLGWRYAAILCRKTYEPPAVADDVPDVGGDVLAVSKAEPAPAK